MTSITTDRLAGITASLGIKAPVRVATTGDITLLGIQTIDDVALAADDRVLVKDQTDSVQNGIYDVKSGAWVRSMDFDGVRDIVKGTLVIVVEGTANADTFWRVTSANDITIGTDAITFALSNNQLSGVSAFMDTVLDDANGLAVMNTLIASATAAALLSALGGIGATETATLTNKTIAYASNTPTGFVKQGLNTIWIPAGAMRPTVLNGCAFLATVETTAGRPDIQVLDFDASADEHAQFQISMPKSWDEGTITAQFFWTHAGGQTGGLDGVRFFIQGVAASDDDTIDVAYGTAIGMVAKDGATAKDLYSSAVTSAITIGGTPAVGDLCFFRVYRDVSDVGDDLDIDARLIGVKMFYTTDAGDDT